MSSSSPAADIATTVAPIVACQAATAWYWDESMIVMAVSIISLFIGAVGLIYTVWDRNRQYKFARQQWEEERAERRAQLGIPPLPRSEGETA